jgi:hypothetical protein
MAGAARGLTIGEAVARLAPDFPGLTVAVLRRLEAEGRFVAGRSPSGYRRYSEADLKWIVAVLSGVAPAAELRPVPDKAAPRTARVSITARVQPGRSAAVRSAAPVVVPVTAPAPSAVHGAPEAVESAANPPTPRRAERRWPEAEFFAPDLGDVALDRDQLAAAARADRPWIDGLVEYGLLPGADPAGGADLLVARASAELAQYGVEPRHLRAVATSAARVAELVAAAVGSGASRDAARRDRGAAGPRRTAEAAAAAVRLHAALVRAALLRA